MRNEQAWGATLLRMTLGFIFVMHGYLAYAVTGAYDTAQMITRMGFPERAATGLAWYLIVAHVVGGLLLLVGAWTRLAALAQLPIVLAALLLYHFEQGFFMKGVIVDAAGGRAVAGGYEYVMLVVISTLAVLLLGPGALSFEKVHERRLLEGRAP